MRFKEFDILNIWVGGDEKLQSRRFIFMRYGFGRRTRALDSLRPDCTVAEIGGSTYKATSRLLALWDSNGRRVLVENV